MCVCVWGGQQSAFSPVDQRSEEITHSSQSGSEVSTSTGLRALDLNAFLLTHLYTKANLAYRRAQS